MIPRDYITEWRDHAPWVQDFQVEQDLVISRALIAIFTHPVLADALAFRGGTALYKLHIHPPARYSEDTPPLTLRLKVEINSREHFTVYGYIQQPFSVTSRWFEGRAEITTYTLDELMATKFRALYQRRKGRDLFDLSVALEKTELDPNRVVTAFWQYMAHGRHNVTRDAFEQNIGGKLLDARFNADIGPLLATGFSWKSQDAIENIRSRLIARLPK